MSDAADVRATLGVAVAFCRVLRGAGLQVPQDATVSYVRALGAVGLADREHVYWAGRATLVRRPEDAGTYDAAFRAFWSGADGGAGAPADVAAPPETLAVAMDDEDADAGPDAGGSDEEQEPAHVLELRYSAAEVLAHKDFAQCTPEELAEAQRLMAAVKWSGPRRTTRRRRPVSRRGDWPDLRRTVREATRTGGEPLRRRWTVRSERPRRVVFLCDVSGSMEPYARALLRFLHVAVAGRQHVEAFTMGTRLTRVTRALAVRDPDAALSHAAQAVPDWSGGTRLGESLRAFNDRFGARGLARGAVVVVLSDGWDRGDPTVLGDEMARLRRAAHRVVWVNPLKATPGYAPLVRGMAAALPHVDEFVEGHSLASLEELVRLLAGETAPPGRGSIEGTGAASGAASGAAWGRSGAVDGLVDRTVA